MKTLTEKKYELAELEKQKKELNKNVTELGIKIKACEDVEKAKEYSNELGQYSKAAKGIEHKINALQSEIAEETAELKALADNATNAMQLQKEDSFNFTQDAYLGSKEAMKDFAEVLRNNAGENNGENVQKAWAEVLLQKGITNPEIVLPTPVMSAIKDAFGKAGTIWSTFKHVFGVYKWGNAFNTSLDTAKGHTAGKDKKEQGITLEKREIGTQFIYKYITIPRYLARESQDVIIAYVLQELPMHVLRMVEKASVIGDGLDDSDDDKIKSFIPIAKDTDSFNTNFYTGDYASQLYDVLLEMHGAIEVDGEQHLVMHSTTYTALKGAKDSTGRYLDPAALLIGGAKTLGGLAVITVDWMPKYKTSVDGDVLAVLYAGDAYTTIGDNVIEQHRNFILQKNSEEFLAEMYAGGGLLEYKGAATLIKGNVTP